MNYLNHNYCDDKKLSIVITAQFALSMFQNVVLVVIPGMMARNNLINMGYALIMLILYAIVTPILVKRNFRFIFLISLFFLSLFLINCLIFPQNFAYITQYLWRVIWNLYIFFIICCLRELRYLYECLVKISRMMILFATIYMIAYIFKTSGISDQYYSMGYSYSCLLPIILLTQNINNKRKTIFNLIDILLASLGLGYIIILGARGPLLCYFVFLILLVFNLDNPAQKAKSIILFLFGSILVYSNLNRIAYILITTLDGVGLKSRTLQFIYENKATYGEERSIFKQNSISVITEHPLKGVGISGDIGFLGSYPHNIILEVLMQFGVVIGGILLFSLILICYKGLFHTYDKYLNKLIHVFFSISIPSLIVSGTFWTNVYFWILVAFCILSLKEKSLFDVNRGVTLNETINT